MSKKHYILRAKVVNIPAEMFIDAFHFLAEAKKLEELPENDLLRGRCCRASIVLAFFSLEAYMNAFIQGHRSKFGVEGLSDRIVRSKKLSFEDKFDLIVPFILGKLTPERKARIWKDFEHVRSIRNGLAHYKGGPAIYEPDNPKGVNIMNAELALEMVRQMIRHLNTLAGSTCPPWINQPESYLKHILMQK